MVKHTATSVVTIERFIIEEERNHPEATGELSGVLYDIAFTSTGDSPNNQQVVFSA